MRFFSTFLVAVSTLATFVSAQTGSGNQITSPTASDKLNAGGQHTIAWTPTTARTDNVNLVLRRGEENNLDVVATIASNIPNSGSFTWNIPANIVSGKDYTIQISWNGGMNFSPRFEIISSATATSSSTRASTSTTVSTSTSTITTLSTTTASSNATISTTRTPTTTTTTRTSTTPTGNNNNTDDDEIPRDSAGSHFGISSFALLGCIAGAMVYLA